MLIGTEKKNKCRDTWDPQLKHVMLKAKTKLPWAVNADGFKCILEVIHPSQNSNPDIEGVG